MKTLEAPFNQNAKIESEKIDCLHRPCSRLAPRGKVESVRTHSSHRTVWFIFAAHTLFFFLETAIAGHERLLLAKWHPKAEKNLWRRRFFNIADRHESCTVDRGCTSVPNAYDATKLAVFFRYFWVFSLTFQWKTACRGDLQTFKAWFV